MAIDQAVPPRIVWEANAGLAIAYAELNQRDKAREHYKSAIDKMESVRANLGGELEKAGFLQDKIAVYKKLIALLVAATSKGLQPDNAAVAFHYVERGRARAFLDLLAEAKVDVTEDATPDLLKRQQELQQRISQLTAPIDQGALAGSYEAK